MVWGMVVIPSFFIFASISLLGTFFVVLRSGVLGLWIRLELGFFGFIPILNGKTVGENEAAAKYFVVQGVGSGLILTSFLLLLSERWLVFSQRFTYIIICLTLLIGFIIKLGVFPFHFWFPRVIGGASWFSCFWLRTVQKIGPFWGISGLGMRSWFVNSLLFFLVFTSVIGGFGGMAQTQFRPLLAYSSLGQTGWIGLISILSLKIFIAYIILYRLLLSGLLLVLHLINSYRVYNIPGSLKRKGIFFWLFRGGFFISLRGVPPFAGSALKLAGVLTIINRYPLFLIMLIFSSIIRLYFYLSIFIRSVICLSDSKSSFYLNNRLARRFIMPVALLVLVNWVVGLPLFLVCGSLLI